MPRAVPTLSSGSNPPIPNLPGYRLHNTLARNRDQVGEAFSEHEELVPTQEYERQFFLLNQLTQLHNVYYEGGNQANLELVELTLSPCLQL